MASGDWEETMAGWDDLYAGDVWREWGRRPPLQITLDWIDALDRRGPCRVLDMGCGVGRHTVLLAERGFAVVASDPSRRAREATCAQLKKRGLQATVIDADMTSIPYPDEHFAGVLSVGVLEHNTKEGIQEALAEIRRVLVPGGKVLASFLPRTRWLPRDDPEHDMVEDNTVRRWGPEQGIHHMVDEEEIRELFAAFSIRWVKRQTETFQAQGADLSSTGLFVSAEKGKSQQPDRAGLR
jgi:SAM-dependent methyltransferase